MSLCSSHCIPEPQSGVVLWTLYKGRERFEAQRFIWSDGGCEVQFRCNGELLYSYRRMEPPLVLRHAGEYRVVLEASGWHVRRQRAVRRYVRTDSTQHSQPVTGLSSPSTTPVIAYAASRS